MCVPDPNFNIRGVPITPINTRSMTGLDARARCLWVVRAAHSSWGHGAVVAQGRGRGEGAVGAAAGVAGARGRGSAAPVGRWAGAGRGRSYGAGARLEGPEAVLRAVHTTGSLRGEGPARRVAPRGVAGRAGFLYAVAVEVAGTRWSVGHRGVPCTRLS